MFAKWKLKSPTHPYSLIRTFIVCTHPWLSKNAPCEDSYQTARMRSLIWIFAGHICPKLRFLTLHISYQFVNVTCEHASYRRFLCRQLPWNYEVSWKALGTQGLPICFKWLEFYTFFADLKSLNVYTFFVGRLIDLIWHISTGRLMKLVFCLTGTWFSSPVSLILVWSDRYLNISLNGWSLQCATNCS